ncbi:MAG: UDP-3-O-acyl-N-acetylglucosamine deacetylase, partial [Alphaproteobacteria bacterium]|nr:UDP-3-O-acyl-N-acetylglucosamine deacetylase [Alphaproteobacteria bacterium]
MQKTLKNSVEINGIGLHSGCKSQIVLHPAEGNSGIVFVRSDVKGAKEVPALYSSVADTRNCTCLADDSGNIVSTIEHIMAALYALDIDNLRIEVNNPEMPIMDGSALAFWDILKNQQLEEQKARRKFLKVKKTVRFEDDKGNYISLQPANQLSVHFVIDFPSKIVGHQEFDDVINKENFVNKIAPARTFCEKYQIDYLRSVGLIKGGSLDNAVVLDGETILNEGGFRVLNECVNHKTLDCVGDMFTSGYRLLAKIDAFHTGHFHNNEV